MEGWSSKILDIDLSTRMISEQPLDAHMARLYLGGRGLGVRLLWDLIGPEVETAWSVGAQCGIDDLPVIHCHPRTAIALSLSRDEIIPDDNEGSYLLRKIPVVSVEFASGSSEMAKTVAEALQGYKIIMQRSHVCFSISETMKDAYQWVSALEELSDIILRHKLLDEPLIEYRKHSESYSKWVETTI